MPVRLAPQMPRPEGVGHQREQRRLSPASLAVDDPDRRVAIRVDKLVQQLATRATGCHAVLGADSHGDDSKNRWKRSDINPGQAQLYRRRPDTANP